MSKDKGKRKIVKAVLEYNFEFPENAKTLKKANNSAMKIKKYKNAKTLKKLTIPKKGQKVLKS